MKKILLVILVCIFALLSVSPYNVNIIDASANVNSHQESGDSQSHLTANNQTQTRPENKSDTSGQISSEVNETDNKEQDDNVQNNVNTQQPAQSEPSDDTFVKVKDYIPDIKVNLKYSSSDNFTGNVIYDFTDAYLRYGTVKKLMAVSEGLAEDGYCLKIWDAFRPVECQFKLWEICPDPIYVADPNNGFSAHSRGNTVDITLISSTGEDITMPTGFDDFSTLADRDYSDVSQEAKANALILENAMIENGFTAYFGEWWHFSDTDTYAVDENFYPPN